VIVELEEENTNLSLMYSFPASEVVIIDYSDDLAIIQIVSLSLKYPVTTLMLSVVEE